VALIVEVLPPRGNEVRQRLRLEHFPCTVGRQLDNDLVLEDPYVDAHHARFVLDEDGSLVLEDLGSVNKLSVTTHPRAERLRLVAGAEFQLGRTRLRIRDALAPVPAALSLHGVASTDEAALPWFERQPARLGSIGVAAIGFGLLAWYGSSSRNAGPAVLGAALAFVLIGLIWAGIWALAGRAVVGQFRIVAHLAVFSRVAFIGLLFTVAVSWVEFLFPENDVAAVIEGIFGIVLFAGMIAAHLASASHQSRARRWRVGALVSGLALLITSAFTWLDDDTFTDVPEFSSVIKNAPVGLVPKQSLEDFGAVVMDLRGEVDSLLAKPTR
jgi:hypothetical protein